MKYSDIIAARDAAIAARVRAKPAKIPFDAQGLHPIVIATWRELERQRPDDYGLLKTHADGTMAVRVTHLHAPRALLILQAVAAAVEDRQWEILPRQGDKRSRIRVGQEDVEYSLSEESKVRNPKKGPTEIRSYQPNGRLRLEVGWWYHGVPRKRWRDGGTQKLEDFIGEFVDMVGNIAEVRRREHHESEERRRKSEEQEALQRKETARRRELAVQSEGWKRASALREMIAEGRRKLISEPDRWPRDNVERWAEWAEALAQQSDPFTNGYFERMVRHG